ncbi:LysM peptidoglycan-binding domain-containing protein [Virgibacillus halophilus]|uniref:LysM peptidoglycan-binding domain-containing protein n=1 Tax=Tigheibacillus halophilus TaxID=361280 RepID=A0ABU5C240_9BACI|nr:LysM peptidoglycan-binding domain-containing protein [Virgibacillus halophilus]
MGVSASAIVASAFFAAQSADAASYSVKSGDSLWTIAQKYNTTVSHLKSINNLSSDLIFPKQVIQTDKKGSIQYIKHIEKYKQSKRQYRFIW